MGFDKMILNEKTRVKEEDFPMQTNLIESQFLSGIERSFSKKKSSRGINPDQP